MYSPESGVLIYFVYFMNFLQFQPKERTGRGVGKAESVFINSGKFQLPS